MDNIFENAYFGKAYKTRDGGKALFQYKDSCQAHLFTETENIDVYLDGTIDYRFFDPSYDIVSEWQETSLSLDNLILQIQVLVTAWNFADIYKTGYKNVEDYVKDKLNYPKQIDEEELDKMAKERYKHDIEGILDGNEEMVLSDLRGAYINGCKEILKRFGLCG